MNEAKGLLDIITHYTQSFVLLNQYDSNAIENIGLNEEVTYEIPYYLATKKMNVLKAPCKASYKPLADNFSTPA